MLFATILFLLFVHIPHGQGACTDYTGYKAGDLAFDFTAEDSQNYHAKCYSFASDYVSGEARQIKDFVALEFKRGLIGLTSKIPEGSTDTYAYANQDSYGQINLELKSCNADVIDQDNVPSTLSFTVDETGSCEESGKKEVANLKLEADILPDCKYTAYMFKDEAAQTAANLNYGMTLPALGDCKAEVVYKFKPKVGGGLDVSFDIYQNAFGGHEEAIRTSMATDTSTAGQVNFFVNKKKLYQGAGFPVDDVTDDEDVVVMSVSTKFVCESDNTKIDVPVTAADGKITFSLTADQAPESCVFLYWDPQMIPVSKYMDSCTSNCNRGGTGTSTGNDGNSSSSLLKFSWLSMLLFLWIRF